MFRTMKTRKTMEQISPQTNRVQSFSNIPMIKQPTNLEVNLYPHQLASVYRMEQLEKTCKIDQDNISIETDFAIQADPTGYGKTLSMITLILRNKFKWKTGLQHSEYSFRSCGAGRLLMTMCCKMREQRINTTLILVDHSLVYQWLREFERAPSLRVRAITNRKMIAETIPYEYDAIIVTRTMFSDFHKHNRTFIWRRFIYDEPSQVRVPGMMKVDAGFTWLVSATPYDIARNFHRTTNYIRTLLNDIPLQCLNMLIIRNPSDFIQYSISLPSTNHKYYDCYDPVNYILDGIGKDSLGEMIRAGSIWEAISSLGGKKTDNLVELVRRDLNQKLEDCRTRLRVSQRMDDSTPSKQRLKNLAVQKWTERIAKHIKEIEQIDQRYEEVLSEDCPICQDKLSKPVLEPNCQRVFCGGCLLTWLKDKNSCPMCRHTITVGDLTYIDRAEDRSNEETKQENRKPSKEEKIIELLTENPDRQFIIFSKHDETYRNIRLILDEHKIEFVEIKGSASCRDKTIEKFKRGLIQVVFLNAKHNGCGINLQNVSDIILYHEMDEFLTTQVIGRANRIGRKEPLLIHHLEV